MLCLSSGYPQYIRSFAVQAAAMPWHTDRLFFSKLTWNHGLYSNTNSYDNLYTERYLKWSKLGSNTSWIFQIVHNIRKNENQTFTKQISRVSTTLSKNIQEITYKRWIFKARRLNQKVGSVSTQKISRYYNTFITSFSGCLKNIIESFFLFFRLILLRNKIINVSSVKSTAWLNRTSTIGG